MTDEKHICLECIKDDPLRDIVAVGATEIQCHYCKHQVLGISISALAEIVDKYLRDYLRIGEYLYPETQEGDLLEWILQEELGIDYGPVVDLIEILKENDPAYPPDGEEPFYRSDENYLRRGESSGQYHQTWKDFTNRIKYQARFFDEIARTQLAAILGDPGSPKAEELPWIEVGPGTKVESFFRVRLADSEEQARKILKDPATELGPPPAVSATAGRMNPAGVSVFYGALSEDTAIAEVRPSVGNLVVVGCFMPSRKLRLFNLPRINIGFTGSIFHPDYEDRLARFIFFKVFHALITRPIQPREEVLEYIPTQAVAEYVANVLGFDGILYASAQVGIVPDDSEPVFDDLKESELRRHNVVLFGEAKLAFQANSAHLVKVKSVTYSHEPTFIRTRDDEDI